jgi:putative ribosome biogenesis GTPase RsgA
MPAKKKKETELQSVAASEHATEGSTARKMPDLPGMVGDGVAQQEVPALDEAVVDYVSERDKRIEHGVKEKANKKLILALMDKHSLASYKVDDYVVVKKPKDDTASIKVVSAADYVGDPKGDDSED